MEIKGIKPLKIGELTVRRPILQGGMGIGISLSSLAGAVAAEGGVGVLSAAQIGFRRPDFKKNPFQANLKALAEEIRRAKAKSRGGVIGVNIMVAMRHYSDYVKAAVDAGADMIISGAGLPAELPRWLKGSKTKSAPIVSSEKAARAICRLWDRHYQYAPDMVIIEGPLAGGHLGFSESQLESFKAKDPTLTARMLSAYDGEIRRILRVVKEFGAKYQKEIPVAVAGGIDTTEKAVHYFSLGADAVQAATPFVATEECDAHPAYKEAYIKAKASDVVILKSPVGMPGRGLKNKFLERVARGEKEGIHCLRCLEHCDPALIPYCITEALIRAAEGDVDGGLLFCGAGVEDIHKISTVREVIANILGR